MMFLLFGKKRRNRNSSDKVPVVVDEVLLRVY